VGALLLGIAVAAVLHQLFDLWLVTTIGMLLGYVLGRSPHVVYLVRSVLPARGDHLPRTSHPTVRQLDIRLKVARMAIESLSDGTAEWEAMFDKLLKRVEQDGTAVGQAGTVEEARLAMEHRSKTIARSVDARGAWEELLDAAERGIAAAEAARPGGTS
jgi:hypothetical protein